MSIFKLPMRIIKQIEKLQLNFLWQGNEAMMSLEVVGILVPLLIVSWDFGKDSCQSTRYFFAKNQIPCLEKGIKSIMPKYGKDMAWTRYGHDKDMDFTHNK